jgi:two-component system, response regulator
MVNEIPTVLLVEDNSDDEELTIRSLKRANLANPVEVARDGQEALDYLFGTESHAARPSPGLLLLDLKLPRVDGLEVLQQIRADPRTRLAPVVILTSSSEDRDVINSYDCGANSFVRKPIDFTEFARAVAQLGIYWLMINQPAPHADDAAKTTGEPERHGDT